MAYGGVRLESKIIIMNTSNVDEQALKSGVTNGNGVEREGGVKLFL